MKLLSLIILLFWATITVQAQEALNVSQPEVIADAPGKTAIEFKMENKLTASVKGARAWVFLMGENGEVVGNNAQWIVSQEKKNMLPTGETQTYKMTLPTQGKAASAKVVFSRIILDDGSSPDPRKVVKLLSEEKK